MLGAAPLHASAAQTVHRCLGQHGEVVFSGTPCGAIYPLSPGANSSMPIVPWSTGGVCPTSAADLRARTTDAFDRHDANALAGLIRWDGVGAAEAKRRMRELAVVVDRPSIRIDFETENSPASLSEENRFADTLSVREGDADVDMRLRIVADGGCNWLVW